EFPVFLPVSRDFDRRRVRTRLRAPPDSLSSREIRLHYRENRKKLPQLGDSCPRTGPEKVSRRTPLTTFATFFSGWLTFSPVFNCSIRRTGCDHKTRTVLVGTDATNCSNSSSAASLAASGAVIVTRISSRLSPIANVRNEQHSCSLRTISRTRSAASGAYRRFST